MGLQRLERSVLRVRIERVDPTDPSAASIRAAADVIRGGGLVAFPTETVYGLGAHALDLVAVARIFAAKGRPAFNPLIVHCADLPAARQLADGWPPDADRLAHAFWPGPLTLVLPKRPLVPDITTAGLPTVALRVPRHPVARALLIAAGVPVAAPSANRSTEISPTTAEHVLKGLRDEVDLVLDAGPSPLGIESTVVDLSGDEPRLLRPGSISAVELRAALGRDLPPPPVYSESDPRPSPGLLERHYSPRARLTLVDAGDASAAGALTREAISAAAVVGGLFLGLAPPEALHHPIPMPDDPAAYARQLYAALHSLDDAGCDLILVERPPEGSDWAGIRDRLTRAAGGR